MENALSLGVDLTPLSGFGAGPPTMPIPLPPTAAKARETIAALADPNASEAERRALILTMQDLMEEAGGSREFRPVHYRAKGLYARELFLKAGTVAMSKIHKRESISIVSYGDVTLFTERGPSRIRAPATIIGMPGEKRFLIVHADTLWTTIHATDKTDLADIEDEFIAKSYDEVPLLESAA